jgi:predicted TIM-barrel fold metal-dependent hydrolase
LSVPSCRLSGKNNRLIAQAVDTSIYTTPKVDCHCHVLDPNGFAYAPDVAYRPAGQETGSADYFAQVLDAYGVQHALLVGPNSGYGTVNRCLLDAIARGQGRFKGVAVVAQDASLEQLQDLKSQGIVGIAFNYSLHGLDYYRNAAPLMERLAVLDMFVQVQVEGDQMHSLAPSLLGSGAKLLIDHCGRPDIAQGLTSKGFTALLDLAQCQRATVKLSGFSKFAQQFYPFADTLPYVHALLAAFGPHHCIWASDWPFLKAEYRLDYGPLLQLFAKAVPNPEDRRAVLWDSPLKLFGFDTK